jgi:hypothetical protein
MMTVTHGDNGSDDDGEDEEGSVAGEDGDDDLGIHNV